MSDMDCVQYYDMDMRERFPTIISHVRRQGKFGICWAMGLISLLEARMATDRGMDMRFPNIWNLSAQELADKFWGLLAVKPPNTEVDENGGYSMGLISAFNLVVMHGVMFEKDYGFMGRRQQSKPRPKDKQLLTVSSFTVIHPNEEKIMISKLDSGICLCASIRIYQEFMDIKAGEDIIYKGWVGSRDPTENDFLGHTVMLTGYGITGTGEKYWRFKNSWGKRWADRGFGKILRGPTAYDPETFSNHFNLLTTVVECGPTKVETVESFAGK